MSAPRRRAVYACDWPECDRTYDRPAKLAEHRTKHTNTVYYHVIYWFIHLFRKTLLVRLRGVVRPSAERPIFSDTLCWFTQRVSPNHFAAPKMVVPSRFLWSIS